MKKHFTVAAGTHVSHALVSLSLAPFTVALTSVSAAKPLDSVGAKCGSRRRRACSAPVVAARHGCAALCWLPFMAHTGHGSPVAILPLRMLASGVEFLKEIAKSGRDDASPPGTPVRLQCSRRGPPARSRPLWGNCTPVRSRAPTPGPSLPTAGSHDVAAPRRFVCSPPALLVALLEAEQEVALAGHCEGCYVEGDATSPTVYVTRHALVQRAMRMCEEPFLPVAPPAQAAAAPGRRGRKKAQNGGSSADVKAGCANSSPADGFGRNPYAKDSTAAGKAPERKCLAWNRIHRLCKLDLVMQRTRCKEPVYTLLSAGRAGTFSSLGAADLQAWLRGERVGSAAAASAGAAAAPGSGSALASSCTAADRLVLLVDAREGGGDARGLREVCAALQQHGTPFATAHLPVGDYLWVARRDGAEYCLPLVMERKRVDDLAASMVDGRYGSQKERMRWCARHLGMDDLRYCVEGDPSKMVLEACCGRGCIAKCGNPTLNEVQDTLEELEREPGLQLVRTASLRDTAAMLHEAHRDLLLCYDDGSLCDTGLTLQELRRRLAKRKGGLPASPLQPASKAVPRGGVGVSGTKKRRTSSPDKPAAPARAHARKRLGTPAIPPAGVEERVVVLDSSESSDGSENGSDHEGEVSAQPGVPEHDGVQETTAAGGHWADSFLGEGAENTLQEEEEDPFAMFGSTRCS